MKKSKTGVFLICFALAAAVIASGLLISERVTEKQAHIAPDYAREDIKPVLERAKVRAAAERIESEERGERRKAKPVFSFSEEDYDLLYHQTGLGRPAVDAVARQKDAKETFLQTQETFFDDPEYICIRDNWISHREQTVDEKGSIVCEGNLVGVEDGDILVTKSSHIFGWRNGHAALVTDAGRRETLEAIVIGENTGNRSFKKWEKYPNVLVLRLKNVDAETRKAAAQWAEENMLDIPYQLTVGFFGTKGEILDSVQADQPVSAETNVRAAASQLSLASGDGSRGVQNGSGGRPAGSDGQAGGENAGTSSDGDIKAVGMAGMLREAAAPTPVNEKRETSGSGEGQIQKKAPAPVEGTQCAHLIWRAYAQFGYDLDANGGWIVTPRQLANSPLLEVVQVYGMDPDQPWR